MRVVPEVHAEHGQRRFHSSGLSSRSEWAGLFGLVRRRLKHPWHRADRDCVKRTVVDPARVQRASWMLAFVAAAAAVALWLGAGEALCVWVMRGPLRAIADFLPAGGLPSTVPTYAGALLLAAVGTPLLARAGRGSAVRAGLAILAGYSAVFFGASVAEFDTLYRADEFVVLFYVAPALAALTLGALAVLPRVAQVNVVVLLVLMGIVELIAGRARARGPGVSLQVTVNDGEKLNRRNPVTGYAPRPSTEAVVTKKLHDAEIYSATYRFDRYGRRVVPHDVSAPQSFLLFFGGSRTFGDGVDDDESVPYHVARRMPRARPYCYAYNGWGPSQFLAILRSRDLSKEIPERRGTVCYVMIEDHIRRATGSLTVSTCYNGGSLPYFVTNADGFVERRGTFVDGRPCTQFWYSLLGRSHTYRWLVGELSVTDAERAQTADILGAIRDELESRFEVQRFAVFYYPDNPGLRAMSPLLDARGIEHLDLSGLFALDDPRYIHHEVDNHLNARGNDVLGRAIAEALGTVRSETPARPQPR